MEVLLKNATRGPDDRTDLLLEVSCESDAGFRIAQISTRGIVSWNRTHQFRLPAKSMSRIRQTLLDRGFLELEERYGDPMAAPRTSCWVSLKLGGVTRTSVQFADGPQSDTLKRLASAVLDECERFAHDAVTAEDLQDGLVKIGRGVLEPEAFTLFVQRLPATPSTESGLYVSLHGCRAEARSYDAQQGLGTLVDLDLECGATTSLASRLVDLEIWRWPANLWAEAYTDLTVQVLHHGKSFQARRFAGMEEERASPHQAAFEELTEILKALHQRVLTEGTERPLQPGRNGDSP